MSDMNSNDPWKKIGQLLEGKLPMPDMPESWAPGTWFHPMVEDIIRQSIPQTPKTETNREETHSYRKEEEETDFLRPEHGAGNSWIQDYIKNAMDRALPPLSPEEAQTASTSAERGLFRPNLTEMGKTLIARFKLPEKYPADRVRLYLSRDRIRLEGLPGGREKTVVLPSPVKVDNCRAQIHNGILEIRMQKSTASREREITIRRF